MLYTGDFVVDLREQTNEEGKRTIYEVYEVEYNVEHVAVIHAIIRNEERDIIMKRSGNLADFEKVNPPYQI